MTADEKRKTKAASRQFTQRKTATRRLNTMNRYFPLPLKLCVCLFLFIGCDSIDENQPARLISTVPAEGEDLDILGLIHLNFDKPVTDVLVDGFAARNRHRESSAVAWEIKVNELEIWQHYFGWHREKLVQLNIAFEDNAGRHHETLTVRRPAMSIDGWPLQISGGNVHKGAKDVDPELLSTAGIQITFDGNIQAGTVVLKPKDGAPLNWIVEWGRASVTLSPSDGDRLQNGTDYILEICLTEPSGARYNFEIRFTTKE